MDPNTLLTALVIVVIFIGLRILRATKRSSRESIVSALAQNALVIDVRSGEEYARGHYPDAVNLPLENLAESLPALMADPSRPVVLYCASGMRSAMARRLFQRAGYVQVLNAGSLDNLPPTQG